MIFVKRIKTRWPMIKCFVVWLVNARDVAALEDCRQSYLSQNYQINPVTERSGP
jgi:hypothetical protein